MIYIEVKKKKNVWKSAKFELMAHEIVSDKVLRKYREHPLQYFLSFLYLYNNIMKYNIFTYIAKPMGKSKIIFSIKSSDSLDKPEINSLTPNLLNVGFYQNLTIL